MPSSLGLAIPCQFHLMAELFEHVARGLEGIVSKRVDAPDRSGLLKARYNTPARPG